MSTPEEKVKVKGTGGGRKPGAKSLTVSQKAEAAALWRAGSVTLDDLAKKFKKRPETFSRLFARMGIEKGSGAAAAMKKAEEAIAAKTLTDTEETLKRISQVKDTHFRMSQQLAVMAFREITQAKAAEVNVGGLKDVMAVYKMASDVIGNSRKELFEILNVEKHDASSELDDLPDLMVRELTNDEVLQLQGTPEEDELGADMIDLEDDE
jgi:hypothetical protein